MLIRNDVQKLEPGQKIRLIEVDGIIFGAVGSYIGTTPQPFRYHCNNIPHTEAEIKAAGGDEKKLPAKSIWFGGHEYSAWPYEVTGISSSSDGQSAEPTMRLANISGAITLLCLNYDDMVQAKVTIIDTFAHYLDPRNFSPAVNGTADPTQRFTQLFYIDSKISEDSEIVEFKLANPMDLQGLQIPTRQIIGLCTWACRGDYKSGRGCAYLPANHGKRMFDLKGNPVTDPALDQCSGLLEDCKARFGAANPLDYGGFPGASLLRR